MLAYSAIIVFGTWRCRTSYSPRKIPRIGIPEFVHAHAALRQVSGLDQPAIREDSKVRHRTQRDPKNMAIRVNFRHVLAPAARMPGPPRRQNLRPRLIDDVAAGHMEPVAFVMDDSRGGARGPPTVFRHFRQHVVPPVNAWSSHRV